MKRILFCLLITLSLSSTSKAQLTITDSLATPDIANLLSGFGVNISNLIVNCDPIAMGEFAGVSEIPISQGLLLTSGWADNLYGPNNNTQTTGVLQLPGDPDLDFMIQSITYDACVVEFDCTPQGDTLLFNFAFGSEEYPEFVGTFNDAFAILLSGPGINGVQNVAQLPNGDVVSTNNVNANVNASYYFDNSAGIHTSYDGFTQNLEVFAVTMPDSTYHFKIVIADNNDYAFDSGVMLEAFSFRSSVDVPLNMAENTNAGFKIAPNPSNGIIKIFDNASGENQTKNIVLTDLSGRVVKTFAMNAKSMSVDLSELSNGYYHLTISQEGQQFHQKILLTK
jgi:hypothetical protein